MNDLLDAVQWGQVPGYLAFVAVCIQGIRKWWNRRRVVAIGPQEETRKSLVTARTLFADLAAKPRRTNWFIDECRRRTAETLRDLADQTGDRLLREHVRAAADSWDAAFAESPGEREVPFRFVGVPRSREDIEGEAEDLRRLDAVTDHAQVGLEAVNHGIARLNALERKVRGRG
ncbi:hypothetical protein [Acrocarpospora catenulata]|uniref:hypothetical protein n=1 Tax=Acrocarpospora catenulata TaxID=2836182 RepID=UPI001BDAB6C8|nr:hypothetical protein [Acrocarpospora catenulata]